MELTCPNCGFLLGHLRIDRRSIAKRDIEMHWVVCDRCSHVALHRWFYLEPEKSKWPGARSDRAS
jgi:hypothetical protein